MWLHTAVLTSFVLLRGPGDLAMLGHSLPAVNVILEHSPPHARARPATPQAPPAPRHWRVGVWWRERGRDGPGASVLRASPSHAPAACGCCALKDVAAQFHGSASHVPAQSRRPALKRVTALQGGARHARGRGDLLLTVVHVTRAAPRTELRAHHHDHNRSVVNYFLTPPLCTPNAVHPPVPATQGGLPASTHRRA